MADYSDLFEPAPRNPNLAVRLNADANPEQEAEYLKLAKRYGAPLPVIRQFPDEYKSRAKADDVDHATQGAPAVRSFLSQSDRARLASDDAPALAKVERSLVGTLGDIGVVAFKGAVGLPQAIVGLSDIQWGGRIGKGLEDLGLDFNEAQKILSGMYSPAQQQANKNVEAARGFLGTIEAMLSNPSTIATTAGESLPQMGAGGVIGRGLMSVAPKLAPWLAAAMGEGVMGAGSAAEQIRGQTDDGLLTAKQSAAALLSGVGTAAFGAAGGKLSTKFGLADIDTMLVKGGVDATTKDALKAGFVTSFIKAGISEGLFEELPQSVQEQMWSNFALNKPLMEGVPEAAAQGLVVGAATGGVAEGYKRLVNRFDDSQRAIDGADRLNDLMAAAAGSALRERSPEQFREFVQAAVDNNESASKSIHVDAQVLNQLPEAVLNQLPESVRAQIPAAAMANATVEIPMADVLTVAPGTPLEQVLNDHARMTPEALSRADAQAAGDRAQALRQEAERVIQQAQDQEAARAEYDTVQQMYAKQLTDAGRYRPQVSEAMGHWLASFYTAYGSRSGLTATQMQARCPVRVVGEPGTAGQVMDQPKPGEMTVDGYHFSAAARSTLSTGFYGTGLKGSAREEILSYPDKRVGQRLSFYFDKGTGIRPESGVGGIAHRAQLKNVYDADADPLKLKGGNAREFEAKVLDAGFSGYATRMDGSQPGQVVMLGEQTIKPEVLGSVSKIETGVRVPALQSREAPWQNYATGAPDEMQAQLERMQANPSWQAYDMRVEGNALQYRKKEAVFNQSVTLRKGDETLAAYGLPPGGKYNTRDIAAALEARQREKWGKIEPDDRSPEAAGKIAEWMAEEVRFEMLHPRKSGVGWYSYKFQRALDAFGEVFPELKKDKDARSILTALIAITSDGQKVVPNFRMAVDLYANYRKGGATEGKFATSRGHARMGSIDGNVALFQKMLEEMGPKAARKYLLQEATVSELRKRAKAEGVEFKTDYQAHVKLPMAAVTFGPKLGAFYANLMGAHGYLTMDRWWSRTFNRYRGTLLPSPTAQGVVRFKELLGKPEMSDDEALSATVAYQASYEKKGFKNGTEIEKAANTLHKAAFTTIEDAPFNATDRAFMLSAVDKAQQILEAEGRKISVADIQAVLWYYEKRLYGELGARQTADVSYEDAAKTVAAEFAGGAGRPDAPGAGEGAAVNDAGSAAGVPQEDVGLEPFQSSGTLAQDGGLTDGQAGNGAGRYSSGGLAPLEGAPAIAGATGPDPRLVAVAEQYAHDNGIDLRRQGSYARVDPERAARIASAYEAMAHAPNDPAVQEAYADLVRQTVDQYLALQRAGYKFWFMDPGADPYRGNPWNAMRDLRANQSMAVFPTEAGFGSGGQVNIGLADPNGGPNLDPATVLEALRVIGAEVEASAIFTSDTEPTLVVKVKKALTKEQGDFLSGLADQEAIAQRTDDEKGALFGPMAEKWGPFNPEFFVTPTGARGNEVANPLLADTGITWAYGSPDGEQRPVLANDLFRAVHDAFGHGLEGAGFRAEGEENAWQAHVRLFTGPSVGAITSETRGQNSWLNYGPHGKKNKTAKVEDTVFAEQKTGLMPEWTWAEGRVDDVSEVLEQRVDQAQTPEFKRWFGDSKVVDANGKPLVVYHGTTSDFDAFNPDNIGDNFGVDEEGFFFTDSKIRASGYADPASEFLAAGMSDPRQQDPKAGANVMPVYLSIQRPLTLGAYTDAFYTNPAVEIDEQGISLTDYFDDNRKSIMDFVKRGGHDGVVFQYKGKTLAVALRPEQIKSAIGNDGSFDANDQSTLSQQAQTPRGTFNPKTLELVLNPNANLSTFFHETGHFFLEVMADIASQPNAPAQIVEDMGTFLKWAGVKDLATWNALDLDGKRRYHERWAESIEQYVMEGRAPSVELQPLMRRFATWLKSVYGAIKQFLAARGQAAPGGETLGQSAGAAPEVQFDEELLAAAVRDTKALQGLYKYDLEEDAQGLLPGKPRTLDRRLAQGRYTEAEIAAEYTGTVALLRARYGDTVTLWRADAPAAERSGETRTVYMADRQTAEKYANRGREAKPYTVPISGIVAVYARPSGYFEVVVSKGAVGGEALGQDPAAPAGPPMALNDDIRRVMDRMLATDEQIAQANEVAGLVPDETADAQAAERLNKRSMADLKWAVRARDQVIAKLRKQAAAIEKDIREQVTVEIDQTPEMRAKKALDALKVTPEYAGVLAEHKAARKAAEATARDEVKAALLADNPDAKGLFKGQLLMKNKRDIDNKVESAMIKWDSENPTPKRPVNATDADVATIADSFEFESVDAMLQAIDAFGSRADAIEGLTERRMLEEHGDLIDERAIAAAANEAVHNEARARSLATELRTQREMLNPRTDTGETTANGSKITVNALVEAAKQFAANVVSKTILRDLTSRAWQHTAAERRAGKRWQEATAAGKTAEAVQAKQDQMLNNAAAKAAIDARAEAKKIFDFFKRVTQGNDEKVVDKGRDPDIVNAARAVLAAYGVQTATTKRADEYLETLAKNDAETFNVVAPMVEGATRNAQPLDALTFEELQALHEEIQAMWFLAKRSRQMEVGGDLLDVQDVADEVYDRLEEIGIPDKIPGETGALTDAEIRARRWLQQVPALLRRVEQWAEAKDGKFGGPFLRYIFQPVKDAADRYRTAKIEYRKKFGDLVDAIAPMMPAGLIQAPEIGYVFGRGHNGIGMSELLHAIAHTGNESNKRKLLLGRGWATENADGTLDTAKWDAFIQRLVSERKLLPPHYDFVQGVWDLMEQTKPLAQKTHREVFGRYFAEVTADEFVDPFGTARRGGYIPAQADPLLVQDAKLRDLLETDNAGMAHAFPATSKGFTKSRVEYNRPLKLDLRTLPQHIDKVLLFSHMEPAVRGVARLLRQPKVSQPLARVDPAAIGEMLQPWLNRSARQAVETPVSADAGLNRVLSTVRSRVGMALMFANVSNTLQQITGFSSAALKVKPGLMTRAAAQFIAGPKRFKEAVWALSPYMADRASNEVAVMSDTMEKILIKPSVYARAETWTREHAYFLQNAFDNVMSPIIWTGAYNQGIAEGMDERMAVRYADGVIRQTQGSTLPEDVSRIETGPAYARVFTQFIGYFNMLANTNGTALQQIASEQGLKKGAGKAFGVVMLGLLVPIWVAEAIAVGMRGGPDDKEDDGYLDDWLAAVFGFGTIRGILGGIPFVGAAAQSAVNRFNDQPADDKFSLSPTVSVLEAAVGAPASVYGAIVDDKNAQKAVRDLSALITVATGLPAMTLARPVGYAAGMAQGRIEPTSPADAARGLVTGTAGPASKQK